MAAWLYEGVLLFGVVFMAGLIFAALTHGHGALLTYRHLLQASVFIVIGFYFIWCWSKGQGQTLAMKTWRIRVVDAKGYPLGRARALWRYVLCWLWFLPPLATAKLLKLSTFESAVLCLGWMLIWALASGLQRQRQFWHDTWAGTRLIDTRPTVSTF